MIFSDIQTIKPELMNTCFDRKKDEDKTVLKTHFPVLF
jgi:hypothetical protein